MVQSKIRSNIIIVGGGAGGMELAALLGNKYRNSNKSITLVDCSPTHIWKPLLHEVAAGSLFTNENEIDYLAYAASHHFHFVLGAFEGLDRNKKKFIWPHFTATTKKYFLNERSCMMF